MSLSALFAAAALAVAAAQTGGTTPPAEAAPPAEPATTVEGVVVTAAPKETVSEFVRAIAEETRSGRIARWNKTICPATLGLQRRYAEYLNDRLGLIARDAGVKVAEPGCRPDILIIVSGDVPTLLAELEKEHGEVFAVRRWSYERTSSGGSQSFEDFMQTPRPVRWWHVSEEVPADGQPFQGDGKTVRVQPSRVRSSMRDDFQHVIIVVDAQQARGVSYQALSDYVAMVALAQLNPNTSTVNVPTVLNLFNDRDAGRAPVAGVTDWDKAYLKALYGIRADTPDGRRQRGRIVGGIRKDGN